MDFIILVGESFGALLNPLTLAYVVGGFFIGTIFAAIPGLTATLALALLLPITYSLDVSTALMACASIYMAGMYGGSISAITVNIPGAPSSLLTALDGYAMQKQGMGAKALGHAAFGSMMGGAIGCLVLIFMAPLVAHLSLLVKTSGKFSLLAFAIVVIVIAERGKVVQAAMAACIGMMMATIGLDAVEPLTRFTFGSENLTSGVDLMSVIIGAFAISEILTQAGDRSIAEKMANAMAKVKIRRRDFVPPFSELQNIGIVTYVKSALIGYSIGVLPGAGGSMGSFLAYVEAVRTSKNPKSFGKGNPTGIAAAESANNAVCGGALVPTLTFGIPGDPVVAIMLGVLVINGIQPGPQLMSTQAHLIAPMIASLLFSAVVLIPLTLYVLGPYFVKIVAIPRGALYGAIALLAVLGSYASTYSVFQMSVALAVGVIAYYMRKNGIPIIAMVLGFILGPNIEEFFRRAMQIANGNPLTFFTNLDSLFFVILTLIFVYFLAIKKPPENPVIPDDAG